MSSTELTIRRAGPDDRSAVIDLCRASLGWNPTDPSEAFFAWKHDDNVFGPSPVWVAETDGRLLGVRVFLRWEFSTPQGEILHAVRAVDTATHPDAQGRGIFTKLTLGALPDLREMGTDLVFNTPNAQSRPGYLKMGWVEVGSVRVAVRVGGPRGLAALRGARTAADKWSEPCDLGLAPADAFSDDDATTRLLGVTRHPAGIATHRSVGYLRWRYSFGPLDYRVLPVGDSIADGAVVFRLRRRGTAIEATIAELLVPRASAARAAVGRILRETAADYAIAAGDRHLAPAGFVPAPRLGPTMTWKPIHRLGVPPMADLDLAMGDVELF